MATWLLQVRTPGAGGAWTSMTYVTDLRWEKEINQIPTLSATVWDPTTAEKALLIEGNDVRVTAAGTEVWYGQIRSIKDVTPVPHNGPRPPKPRRV